MKVAIEPIHESDLPAVAEFLNREYPYRHGSVEYWHETARTPWPGNHPNYGFKLVQAGEIVGVHLAYYSVREGPDGPQRHCGLGSWCVRPDHRWQAIRLLKAILDQDGYSFTDVAPAEPVIPINRRLGLAELGGVEAVAVPSLPWPTVPGRVKVIDRSEAIAAALTETEARIYRDHCEAPGIRHALIKLRGEGHCHVIYRRHWRHNLPVATLIYASDPEILKRAARAFSRFLLFRRGIAALAVEHRLVPNYPGPHMRLSSPRVRMFRGWNGTLPPRDYLYTELVCRPEGPRSEPI